MPQPHQPLPSAAPTREEIALTEVGRTAVAPGLARALVACFLTAISAVPLVEFGGLRARAEDAASAWAHLTDIPRAVGSASAAAGPWEVTVAANRRVLAGLSAFERALEDESALGRLLRPPAQQLMADRLGAGNERVYVGKEGWLFYRADVEYVTGPPFLDASPLERRAAAASEWETPPQADPRAAVTRFARDLEARGVALILMPTPLKPGVHPEMLAAGYDDARHVLQNPSFRIFVEEVGRAGVMVFDPSDALAMARRTGAQYLTSDTHWRPEAMEAIADRLAAFISERVTLPAVADPRYRVEQREIRSVGDTARMLDLPRDGMLSRPETVWVRRILQRDGSPWRATREADVLVLGDSFSNIYALESMGWGTSAGFVEHLSHALERPVDRLVQNDDGAFATRAMLQRVPDRLNGKRVVVYQFAARELALGDWKVLPLPAASAAAHSARTIGAGAGIGHGTAPGRPPAGGR